MNSTLDLINARTSTRTFAPTPSPRAESEAILHAALRAPTAGAMMLVLDHPDRRPGAQGPARRYLRRPALHRQGAVGARLRRRLPAVDGPLRGVGRRDRFRASRTATTPGLGDLMIGVLGRAHRRAERGRSPPSRSASGRATSATSSSTARQHAELLGLPNHTLPVAMLVLRPPAVERAPPTPHCTRTWCTPTATTG